MTDAFSTRRTAPLEFLRGDARSDFLHSADPIASTHTTDLPGAPISLLRFEHRRSVRIDRAAPHLLHPLDGDVIDTWQIGAGEAPLVVDGCLRYRTDGVWLAGTAIVDDRQHPQGLEGAAFEAYGAVFAELAKRRTDEHPFHLLRLWNYMADINGDAAGEERYRRFNVGRQRAFQAANRSAFDGSPAACALGTRQGPFTMHFLAGPVSPVAVENPRQVSAYRYPSEYGPSSPTFSRAAIANLDAEREALLISGTASIVGHASQHPGDVVAQVEETWRNIDALLQRAAQSPGAADRGGQAVHRREQLDCTIYVRRLADLPLVRATVERIVGTDSMSARRAVYLRADICRADLLVEIEAQSIAAVAQTPRAANRHPAGVEAAS